MAGASGPYDALIVGGGHNGLVCASYLAAGGLRVCVVEKRAAVGGAAVTEEFHPGFRNSTASYTVSLLNPKVIRDLRLADHGLRIVERPFANFLPLPDGRFIKVGGGVEATQREIAKFSKRDAERLPEYYARLEVVSDVLRGLLLETPPNVGGGVAEIFSAWKAGRRLNRLPLAAKRDVLDLFTVSATEWLERWFESDPIKACFGFDAVVGNFASPHSPGSAYVLLHHVFGEVNGKMGSWGHAIGGMGAITQAMRLEAEARGVEIRTGKGVARILVREGRARGVALDDGAQIAARCVVSNAHPRLLLDLLGEEGGEWREAFGHYQS
ncbi:MAG TPA: NAD(P)/FAD-dependent oxidoreductase, partial [Usitatibacter sp.]